MFEGVSAPPRFSGTMWSMTWPGQPWGWDLPELPMIDEDKEVSAKARKLDRMLQTHSSVLSGLQIDRDEQLAKRIEELKTAADAAHQVEKETDGLIQAKDIWRHLAGLDTGKTLAAVKAAEVAGEL